MFRNIDSADALYRSRKLSSFARFVKSALTSAPEVVYVMDMAWSGVLAGAIAKLVRRCRMVVDTGDATYALARSIGRRNILQCWLVWMVEQIGLRFSDCIVVRGRYHRLYLRHRGFRSVVEIPDCVDAAPFELDPRATALRSALGLNGFLAVGLIGKLVWDRRHQICYGWDLVEALALLRDLPVKGVIIGDGDGRSHLERRAAELKVEDRLIFVPPVSIEEARTYIQVLDVGLSTQSDDLGGWVRTTGKLVQYLQENRFVLATEVGQASWVLPPEMLLPYSGAVDREHPRRLAGRLASFVRDPNQLKLAAIGSEIVCCHFDVKKLAPRLATALALAQRRAAITSSLNPKSGAA